MSIRELVDRGLELRREITERQKELKDVETRLKNHARQAPQEDLKDADRDGKQYRAHGSTAIVPVVFTADVIAGSFVDGGKQHERILEAMRPSGGLRLAAFFKPIRAWENLFDDGKKFRAAALAADDKHGPAFITACLSRDKFNIPKSAEKILWDDAEEITAT